jgi:hypothetical protein
MSSPSSARSYDLSGNLDEQARDAIKNGDTAGLEKLLGAGANAGCSAALSFLALMAVFFFFFLSCLFLCLQRL